jgi:hypothetical protein
MGGLGHGEVRWDEARRSSAPVDSDSRESNSRMLGWKRAVKPQKDDSWSAPPLPGVRLEVNDIMAVSLMSLPAHLQFSRSGPNRHVSFRASAPILVAS